jgi:hypothetical protein
MPDSGATDTDATPFVSIPDRADAPVSETTERFFRAIAAVVPVERIEELHLFSPLRQGAVETGIAVIAARVARAAPVEPAPAETPLELSLDETIETPGDAHGETITEMPEAEVPDAEVLASLDGTDAERLAEQADGVAHDDAGSPDAQADGTPVEASDEVTSVDAAVADGEDDSPYAPETVHHIVEEAMEETAEIVSEVVASEQAVATPVERHTVYTARYRLVQKGPERGKWETDVRDEADAPLMTVEMVVRGVQRRAGEASETTRYTGAQVARALRLPGPPA